jgi:hypothetical protein
MTFEGYHSSARSSVLRLSRLRPAQHLFSKAALEEAWLD